MCRSAPAPPSRQEARRASNAFFPNRAHTSAQTKPGERDTGKPRQKVGLQQSGIKPFHASGMLGMAFLDKPAEGKAVEKDACLRRREIPAVVRAAPAPDGLEQATHSPRIIMRRGCTAQPRCAVSAGNLLPRHP